MPDSRHYILGTAGHIDHGKSSLVQALTGTNPDRLPEEKARGMTIELGFANLEMPTTDESGDELAIGVIDVPGHADFVKNMVAGVGSIDLALFIIAADDGWMPQTEEHYQILSYLKVPRAIVALTKVDLVDDLELVLEDISDHLGGGEWENVSIIPTSSHTGQGIDELRQEISQALTKAAPVMDCGKPRLPVDRVFSPKGVGTVVTGTLTDGSVKAGMDLVVQPGGMDASVRTVQSHSANQEQVPPGTRTALNLTGVGVAQRGVEGISRGNVLTLLSLGEAVSSIDVLLEKSSREVHGQPTPKPVKTGRQVRFHYGSASYDARAHFLNAKHLEPGGTVLAELRFAEPIYVFVGDRFVLRDASLGVTLAGGVVLDEDANRRMFRKAWQETFLESRAANPDDLETLVLSQLIRDQAVSKSKLLRKSRFSAEAIGEMVTSLTESGKLAESGNWVFDRDWWKKVSERAGEMVQKVHTENPELPGLPIRDLRSAVEADLPQKRLFEVILDGLLSGEFAKAGPNIRHRDHLPKLPPDLKQAGEKVRKVLIEDVLQPPNKAEIATSPAEEKALKFLIEVGEAISLDPKTVISAQGYEEIKGAVIDYLRSHGKGTASDLRKVVGTTRRILMPILERFDAEGLTMRQGDFRTLK